MAGKVRTTFLYVVASVFFCAFLYHHYLRDAVSAISSDLIPTSTSAISSDLIPTSTSAISSDLIPTSTSLINISSTSNFAIRENLTDASTVNIPPQTSPVVSPAPPPPPTPSPLSTASILLPDWEVLVIVSPDDQSSILDGNYSCVFDTGEISPASFSGVLHFPDRSTFSCILPMRARLRLPFKQPALSASGSTAAESPPPQPLLRWSYISYDSLTTDNDVVLFVKGVNVRQGINRSPSEFRCVFGEKNDAVRTAVTSSIQEVFRCKRPGTLEAINDGGSVKISLEIVAENSVVPSIAHYSPPRKLAPGSGRSLLCAATMVYDVAKFLREWVMYHSSIGVEKFLLYDNGSDDELAKSVDELIREGFDISTYLWRWPKTQEAGFSHSSVYAKDACKWVMYVDVDEFVYSPNWRNVSKPSNSLLHSLISWPRKNSSKLGQVSIGCHEFGPSGQDVNPPMGVTQGYNCRRRYENRHKSIVLLEAVDASLLNAIHHFKLRAGRRTKKPSSHDVVVNHYKYQAWPEFKAKFRRRVSAYVLDWTQKLNPKSNDRAPGLGFSAVEPKGWANKFCEVHDNKLRDLVRRWFGAESGSGLKMGWQR